jgi:hypothetical protein
MRQEQTDLWKWPHVTSVWRAVTRPPDTEGSCSGHPTEVDPQIWGLGERLITPCRKSNLLRNVAHGLGIDSLGGGVNKPKKHMLKCIGFIWLKVLSCKYKKKLTFFVK